MTKAEALKTLLVKIAGEGSAEDYPEEEVSELIRLIAEKYTASGGGTPGPQGEKGEKAIREMRGHREKKVRKVIQETQGRRENR